MKHRALVLAAFVAAGILLLTACTSSEEGIGQDVRIESSGNAGTSDAGSSDSAVAQPDASQNTGGDAGATDISGTPAQTEGQTGEKLSQAGTDTTEGAQTEASQENSTGETATEDIWSGTYASDQETVTISLVDAKSFSFAFANSGIASSAEVDGSTAVYRGDDHHVVVFEMNEGVLTVTVSSEEDYDASDSPLNGTYVRQTVDTSTE